MNYLRYIHETWNAIVAGVDDYEPNVVDEKTVACLETMVPGTSKADGDKITGAMTGKSIFRNITSDEHRNRILQNIHQLPGMIPSLFTFFESLKYLEPCAKIMRVLCDPKPKVCVKEALQRVYHRPERLTVEYAENDFREHTTALESTFAIGYQQLWLFALRNFPQMSSATTLMESDQGRPKATAQNPLLWKAFGQLAARVGFRSEQIDRLVAANAVEELAKQLASSFGAQVDVRFVEEIASVLRRKTIVHEDAAELSLASVRTLPLNFRCGLPFTNHHQLDRAHLFLPKLQPGPIEQIENVSTFYFKREMFNHFLGDRVSQVRRVTLTRLLLASSSMKNFLHMLPTKKLPIDQASWVVMLVTLAIVKKIRSWGSKLRSVSMHLTSKSFLPMRTTRMKSKGFKARLMSSLC